MPGRGADIPLGLFNSPLKLSVQEHTVDGRSMAWGMVMKSFDLIYWLKGEPCLRIANQRKAAAQQS